MPNRARPALWASALISLALALQACGASAASPAGQTVSAGASGQAATTVKDIVAAANKEGKVRAYVNSSATKEWVQKLQTAFNAEYGTNIAIDPTPGGGYTADTTKVVTET